MKVSALGEFGLIEKLAKTVALNSKDVVCTIGDDTAVVKYTKDKYLLLTTDMLVEGRHFLKVDLPHKVGHKALAVNISDIAAMGGIPKYALISIGVSSETSFSYIKSMYQGLHKLAKKYHVVVVGGDTVKSDKLIINVALVGEVKKSRVVFRNTAKDKDRIFVTGMFGGSLKSQKHLTFQPRVDEAQFLVEKIKPSAMIDCSDGLAADLNHILKLSKCGATIFEDQIPVSKGSSLKQALYDGEDFELIFTISPTKAEKLKRLKSKYRFKEIGFLHKKRGLFLQDEFKKTKAINPKGFTHF